MTNEDSFHNPTPLWIDFAFCGACLSLIIYLFSVLIGNPLSDDIVYSIFLCIVIIGFIVQSVKMRKEE